MAVDPKIKRLIDKLQKGPSFEGMYEYILQRIVQLSRTAGQDAIDTVDYLRQYVYNLIGVESTYSNLVGVVHDRIYNSREFQEYFLLDTPWSQQDEMSLEFVGALYNLQAATNPGPDPTSSLPAFNVLQRGVQTCLGPWRSRIEVVALSAVFYVATEAGRNARIRIGAR